jgi:glycosyltransferase involved in cell wall biosynthesis
MWRDSVDIDVVIPFKDSLRFIEPCVASVLLQSHAQLNVLVVDDASSPKASHGLSCVLARFSDRRVRLIRLPKGVGPSGARNAGIRMGNSPFVAFLDADDIWHPDKLARQVSLLSSALGSTCAVYSGYDHIDERGCFAGEGLVLPKLRGSVHKKLLFGGNLISGSCSSVLVRRAALETVGLFDEKLRFAEDWDLWLRLARIGEFDFLADTLASIRLHKDSLQFNLKSSRAEVELLSILSVVGKQSTPECEELFRHYKQIASRFARKELTFGQISKLRALLRESGPFCTKVAEHLSLLHIVRGWPKIFLRSLLR